MIKQTILKTNISILFFNQKHDISVVFPLLLWYEAGIMWWEWTDTCNFVFVLVISNLYYFFSVVNMGDFLPSEIVEKFSVGTYFIYLFKI